MKCAVSLSTSSSGEVVRYWQYPLPTPVRSALTVVIQQRKTARHKVNSSALNVDIQRMLISMGHVTF